MYCKSFFWHLNNVESITVNREYVLFGRFFSPMSLLTINTLRKLMCWFYFVSKCQAFAEQGCFNLQDYTTHNAPTASNKEVSWRCLYFVIDEPRHCVSPDFLVTDSWIHGFTAAQWVRGDPEPPALQRHLFSEQWQSCQTCIANWRRHGRTISAGVLWRLTGRTLTCSVCFMSCSISLWSHKTMLWFVYIRFIPVGS